MFCDEPTSGLDSFMAINVISLLKEMASQGRTIICSIHQPSSQLFEMLDYILLLANGRVAFIGDKGDNGVRMLYYKIQLISKTFSQKKLSISFQAFIWIVQRIIIQQIFISKNYRLFLNSRNIVLKKLM